LQPFYNCENVTAILGGRRDIVLAEVQGKDCFNESVHSNHYFFLGLNFLVVFYSLKGVFEMKNKFAMAMSLVLVHGLIATTFALATAQAQMVSANLAGTNGGNGASGTPVVSADGRFVAFYSWASDLVSNDTNNTIDVFVRDLQNRTTALVSLNRFGTDSGNHYSYDPVISADGRFVAFESYASNLVSNDVNIDYDVFVRDLQNGTTALVSVNRFGTDSGNGYSYVSSISADGRFVAFESEARDLVSNDTTITIDVFVRDLQNGTTALVSANLAGTNGGNNVSLSPRVSADGSVVAFESRASDLVGNTDTGFRDDVFVRDLQSGTTKLVSVNLAGTNSGNNASESPVISADGRFVAFVSNASDLVSNDTNNTTDVFVRDLQNGTIALASVNLAGTNGGNGYSFHPSISADGRVVAFESAASDLVSNDTNSIGDIFVRDLENGTTSLVNVNLAGTSGGYSYGKVLSADGRFVAFESYASNLVSNDTNNTIDVFVREVSFNQSPTTDAGGPYNLTEGGSVIVTASGNDPEGGPLSYAWDLDNDGNFETSGQSVTFSAAALDGPSTPTIKVQVTDDGGLMAIAPATVNVLNVAPTADFTSTPSTLLQGQSATLAFSNPFDPGAEDAAFGFLYSYDCTNDGTFELASAPDASYSCAYPTAGTFTARSRIADNDVGFTNYTVAITVLTPREGTEGLIDQVYALIPGTLNDGQGNALIAKLEVALQQLDRGNVATAINQLEAFVNQVNALIGGGTLPATEGKSLIDAANMILAALSGQG
jgi:hypothetical protein